MDNKSAQPSQGTSGPLPAARGMEPGTASELLQVQQMPIDQLRKFAEGGYLYAILDACDAPAVPPKMQELGEQRASSLFRGSAEEQYSAVAPYLLAVDPPTLDWIVENLWAEPWGVFVMSKADLETLRTHLRRFLIVQLPDGEKWFFRYYDPRILNPYLAACKQGEIEAFFGPVRAFGITRQDDISLVQAAAAPGGASNSRTTVPDASLLWHIRPEQVAALGKPALDTFADRMVVHLNKFFPEQCAALGKDKTEEAIRYGIERAATYGFISERDVCKYIDLMFAFGRDFDKDGMHVWAGEILAGTEPEDPSARMDRLYGAAMSHVRLLAMAREER